MARVAMIGGGMVGLTTAMVLGRHGHEVTVLERNPAPPPPTLDEAWEDWERPGCAQFRMGHWFLARFRHIIEAELPELIGSFSAAGALRTSVMDAAPFPGRDGDDLFEVVTGRRPIFEWVVANAAAGEDNLDLRRGVAVTALVTGTEVAPGVPNVVGVRTDAGDLIDADLVIDAGGRRSTLRQMLEAIGAKPFFEESEDLGFRYYGRYFAGDAFPDTPIANQLGGEGVGGLILPADNTTWMVGVTTTTKDKALYGLADEDRWNRAIHTFGAARPWVEGGTPLTSVETMIGIPDRYRRLVVDGQPVATGVALIGDAWAATNPSLGRGISMGLLQSMIVVDELDAGHGDPLVLSKAIDTRVEAEVAPYYQGSLSTDRGTIREFEAALTGRPAKVDPQQAAFMHARFLHEDVFRAFAKLVNLLATPKEAIDGPVIEAIMACAELDSAPMPPTPTRAELVAIAAS